MYLISDGGIITNTLDTFDSVLLTNNIKNIDGVKLDIRKSRDNVFVLSKYNELEKFTYGKGNINDYNYSYLRKVKFPSHIFKYYIPTLEEILKTYSPNKIIVLEIYQTDNLDRLFIILVKYYYKYYFLSKDEIVLNKLKELDFDKIGTIISYKDIISNITKKDIYRNTFFIRD